MNMYYTQIRQIEPTTSGEESRIIANCTKRVVIEYIKY